MSFELPRACASCGKRLVVLQLGDTSSALCDYCAHAVQQDETRKAQTGAPPPPDAYTRSLWWDQHPLGPTKREV